MGGTGKLPMQMSRTAMQSCGVIIRVRCNEQEWHAEVAEQLQWASYHQLGYTS